MNYSLIRLAFVVTFMLIHNAGNANGSREFINGTNYRCYEEGNLIELPNHLRKPCMLCTCKKGMVVCEKLKPCASNYREDRKRRSIRCIEEECCNVVEDVFLNNVDSSSKLVAYRTLDASNTNEINNQIRTSTIRYVHCSNDLSRNNQQNSYQSDQSDHPTMDFSINHANFTQNNLYNQLNFKPFGSRSTINTRSVTAHPNSNNHPERQQQHQAKNLCTLSNSLNRDTNKHRQYITTFDGMRIRLRSKDHCHFVFARDCVGEQFTIHLLYSGNPHLRATNGSMNSSEKSSTDAKKFASLSSETTASNQLFDSINLTSTIDTLDGKSTSNYTRRYLNTLKQSRSFSRERLSLYVRIGKNRIRLDSHLNVKLDNRLILLPYAHRGLKIINYQNHIIIKSNIGLQIIWSGQEVVTSLPKHFQQQTCGLCANFNDDLSDDLKNRRNQIVSQLRFLQSWTTGKNRQCLINNKHRKSAQPVEKLKSKDEESNLIRNATNPKWTFKRKMKAAKFCNALKINMPVECQKPDVKTYYEECMEKMRVCNRKSCNCEILTSYVDKCSQVLANSTTHFNTTVFENECPNSASQPNGNNQSRTARNLELLRPDKKEALSDLSTKCPEGSVHSTCAPIKYKVTCSDLLSTSEFNNRLPEQLDVCQAGCRCEANHVWSDNGFTKCIHIDLCSSLSTNLRKRTINSLNSLINRPRFTLLN